LIDDGALNANRYKTLLIFQANIVDQSIIEWFERFAKNGGKIIRIGNEPIANIEGKPWKQPSKLRSTAAVNSDQKWLKELQQELVGVKGVDGKLDGVWSCRRGNETFWFNSKDKEATVSTATGDVKIAPYTISESTTKWP